MDICLPTCFIIIDCGSIKLWEIEFISGFFTFPKELTFSDFVITGSSPQRTCVNWTIGNSKVFYRVKFWRLKMKVALGWKMKDRKASSSLKACVSLRQFSLKLALAILLLHKLHEKLPVVTYRAKDILPNIFVVVCAMRLTVANDTATNFSVGVA